MIDDGLQPPEIQPARARQWPRLSLVWLVPVLALVISLGVALQSYLQRGTLVHIAFTSASGVEAGKTAIKYRDVNVGLVEAVRFSDDLTKVIVAARIDKDIAPFLDEDANFWVVRPQVSVRGVTGLDTVLSGVFIQGSWNSERGTQRTAFDGLDEAPLVTPDQAGIRIALTAPSGNQLSAGAPLLYKGVKVGYIETPKLNRAGTRVTVLAFVEAPYDRLITSTTRFWDSSGFSISLGRDGLTMDVSSLASLVEGGIVFENIVSGGIPIEPGYSFTIYEDETTARDSLLNDRNDSDLLMSVVFDGSVQGLVAGADVRLRGIRVGTVRDLSIRVVDENGDRTVQLLTNLALRPSRLGMENTASQADAMALMQAYVEQGLRARLASTGILTGSLIVELVELPDAPPASIDTAAEPYPVLPAAPAAITDFNATAEGVFERINALPIEEVLQSAIDLMDSVDRIASDAAIQGTPDALKGLIDDARGLIGSDDAKALAGDLRATIADVRSITGELREAQTVTNLNDAITRAAAAAANIETASADFPAITGELKQLGETANSLAVQDLVASASATLASVDALIGTDDARKLPPALTGALDEMRVFLSEVREGGAIDNANSALASADAAAKAVEEAAASLPALSERLNKLVADAGAVLGNYGNRSRFNAETLATLNDIQAAADAVRTLARMLQRDPNSILFGR